MKPKLFRTPKTKRATGFILISVLVPLFALLVLTCSVAVLVANRWVETQEVQDTGYLQEHLDSILWTMRYHYHNLAISSPVPLTNQSAANIIASALNSMGFNGGGSGMWATEGTADGRTPIQLRITPVLLVNPSGPTVLQNTGTFLDGRQILQGQFQFKIEEKGGASQASLSETRTLIFCQVPSDSLALSGLADLTNLSGNLAAFTVAGTSFVRGQVNSSVAFDFSGSNALQAGSYGDNVSRSGQGLAGFAQQAQYRYQTEIVHSRTDLSTASQDLRTSSVQRVASLQSALPASVLLKEGVAGDPTLSGAQSALYQTSQLFYQVPRSNRFWLVHNPLLGSIAPAPSQFNEVNYASQAVPLGNWVVSQSIKNVAGFDQVVLKIDPSLAPSPLFIGSIRNGSYGDYSGFIVEIKSGATLPQDFSLISPNSIVFNGDLNTDNSHNVTISGAQVAFGYTQLTQMFFAGSYSSLQGLSPSPWRNAQGAEHSVAQVTIQERAAVTSPVTYYATLLQKIN